MSSPPLHNQLRGARVLLTGSTGFLGKVWLEMALRLIPEIGRIYLLSRPGKFRSSRERFENLFATSPVFRELRAAHGANFGSWLAERVTVVDGDVALPGLGIAPGMYKQLCEEVDAVLNFAGITDFQPDPKSAEQINVRGALHVADLAAATRTKKLLHVSTCYVAGNQSGAIPEDLDPYVSPNQTPLHPNQEHEHLCALNAAHPRRTADRIQAVADRAESLGWPNIYTYSKAIAERTLWLRDDIDLVLLRPSIVECAIQTPFAGWNEGINTSAPLSWLIASYFRDLPAKPNNRFDIVPVDTVARAVFQVLNGMLTGQAKRVYQVASSDTNPLTFGRTIELNGLAVRRYIRRHGGSLSDRLILQHLDPVGVPLSAQAWWRVPNLKTLAESAKTYLAEQDPKELLPKALQSVLGDVVAEGADALREQVIGAHRQLRRVEKMLELYQPFIHDNDYQFITGNIRDLDRSLPPEDRPALGWNIDAIDWRTYWVDVQYPGLKRWSIPLIHGDDVPDDPPPPHPVNLGGSVTDEMPSSQPVPPVQETHV
jgi:nucleoside-diphosphate-sugar epimerase